MKLLYPCADSANDPLLWSGIVWNCRRALEEVGVEIAVLDQIPFECPASLRLLHQWHKRIGRKTHLLQIEPALLRRAADRIKTRFAQGDCDAVFSPGTGVPVYALLPPSIPFFAYLDATKASWIRTYFGLETLCARSRRHVDEVDRASLENSATTFFASHWGVHQAIADYGIAAEKFAVVPFGANLVDPPSRAEVERWIAARPRDRFRFFFLGKEWERKGGPEALALIRQLQSRGLDATIDIVGCTPELSAADRSLVQLHGFIDHSRPEGRKKLRELLAAAHVLLFLSRAEAFGIAVCEAAAFGVPTLGANTGGIPTIVRPGENGWLSPVPFSAIAAAEALAPALRSPAIYQQLARGARADFETRLNWRAAATAIRSRIEMTLAKR